MSPQTRATRKPPLCKGGNACDRRRGRRKGARVGAAVEKREEGGSPKQAFFGHRKRALPSKCEAEGLSGEAHIRLFWKNLQPLSQPNG